MDLQKEKRETVLVSMTEGSWITNAFIDKESFKANKHDNFPDIYWVHCPRMKAIMRKV